MIRPAGYSSDEDSDVEYESGYDEDQPDDRNCPELSLQNLMENDTLEQVRIFMSEIQDYENYKLRNGFVPLVFAARLGALDKLEYLLNYERDNYPKKLEQSKHEAFVAICSVPPNQSHEDHVKCLELLITYDTDPNLKDRYGMNPLMIACKYAPIEIVELLLTLEDVFVDEIDNEGWSPLFYAVNRGDMGIVSLLMQNKANVDILDKKKRYAYTIAVDKNFTDIADLVKSSVIIKRETDETKNCRKPANTKNTAFQEDDTSYYNQVLEMVDSSAVGTDRYAPAFEKNKISLRQFLLFKTDAEISDAGVLFSGHRKIMLHRIKEFHLGAWSPMSLGYSNFKNDDDCSSGLRTTLTFTASLHLQLYVLRCTLKYMESGMKDSDVQQREKIVQYLRKIKKNLLNFTNRMSQLRTSVDVIREKSAPFLNAQVLTDTLYS